MTFVSQLYLCFELLQFTQETKEKQCAKRKAQMFFYWLTLPTNELSSGVGSSFSFSNDFFSEYDSMQLHNEDQSAHFIIDQKKKKIEPRWQSILRKQQILCNKTEVETLTKNISLLEYIQMYHVFTRVSRLSNVSRLCI